MQDTSPASDAPDRAPAPAPGYVPTHPRTPTPVPFDELVPCQECRGTGKFLVRNPRCCHPTSTDPGEHEVPCSTCAGAGFFDLDEAIDRGILA